MCPKCKSRERVRIDGECIICVSLGVSDLLSWPMVYFYNEMPSEKFQWESYIYFICSECGYEIGRWG